MPDVLHRLDQKGNDNNPSLAFFCPGCNCGHSIWTTGKVAWAWNGSMEKPTFSPSIKVGGREPLTDEEHARVMAGETINKPETVCHSFVNDGNIEFLSDCTHLLRGQTVALEPF